MWLSLFSEFKLLLDWSKAQFLLQDICDLLNVKKIGSVSILFLGKANLGLLILIETIMCTVSSNCGLLHQNNSSWEGKGKQWTHLFEGVISCWKS